MLSLSASIDVPKLDEWVGLGDFGVWRRAWASGGDARAARNDMVKCASRLWLAQSSVAPQRPRSGSATVRRTV